MSDNQNIAGSAYRQTKGVVEPEKEREPMQLSSTAADIVSGCCPCAACAIRRKLCATCLHTAAAVTSLLLLPRSGLRICVCRSASRSRVAATRRRRQKGPTPAQPLQALLAPTPRQQTLASRT